MSACVPTSIAISPPATHFKSCEREMSVARPRAVLEGNFLQPLPVMSPIFIGRSLKYSINDWKCCAARISVGAMYATWSVPETRPGVCCRPGLQCFPRPDISFQEPRHRMRLFKIFQNIRDRALLGFCRWKIEGSKEARCVFAAAFDGEGCLAVGQ